MGTYARRSRHRTGSSKDLTRILDVAVETSFKNALVDRVGKLSLPKFFSQSSYIEKITWDLSGESCTAIE